MDEALKKYGKILGQDSRVGELACKVAIDCFFGHSVLVQCTVNGFLDKPALPSEEVELKRVLFKQFPKYWTSPQEFEPLWVDSVKAINQKCARLRRKVPVK